MTTDAEKLEELSSTRVAHLTAPFSPIRAEAFIGIDTLPYADLGGPGFERLCFELLLAKGYEVRFFGRSGQRQPEVDLVASRDGRTEVFTCKNLSYEPTCDDLRERLDTFEKKWLADTKLTKPHRLVICWPRRFRDTKLEHEWDQEREDFRRRTGVTADFWHLDQLDGWLKRQPEVVADLFSGRHAELFCDVEDWKPDLFIPLREGASGDPRLKRFFQHQREERLYLDEFQEQEIEEALERSPIILVRGLPGSGKTFTSLTFASRFQNGRWRTYFTDVAVEEATSVQIREGVRRRRTHPTVFVLENCHERIDVVERALRDLAPELEAGRVKIICLARWIPGPETSRSDDSELFLKLEAEGATVDLALDDRRLRSMIDFWRPDLEGLSQDRLTKLHALSAGDLLLLDEVLSQIESPVDIDSLSLEQVYSRIRREYLGFTTADDLVSTRRLAALAQFEIRPRTELLEFTPSELALARDLCVRAGHPPRWFFLHSTAAELILHALWHGLGVT